MITTRRLAAILAGDVAGYSRLMGADEVGTLEALKACRAHVVDPAIAEHNGRIVKTTGDGMLVEFASAVDAVTCAMAVQIRMAERGGNISFRIGINVGDVIVDGEDLFGDGVNVAARVENECLAGGVFLSGNAFEQVRGKTDFAFDDLGERVLKNIDRPVRLYAMRLGSAGATEKPVSQSDFKPLTPLDKPSIAVLPFQNMSGDPEQEYFADGMVEDIITALSRFKSLFVIARNSSFTYKGKAVDIKQVGHELGVRYVLEGSVRKANGRVRITGQLIEAATGTHLWADRFDGPIDDVFDLQDRVTSSVAAIIAPRIEQIEIEKAVRKPTDSLAAYDYYLRGIACYDQWTPHDSNDALNMFRKAVELDPTFAAPMAWIGACYCQRLMQRWMDDPTKESAEAVRVATRALQFAKEDAFVLGSVATTLFLCSDEDVGVTVSLADRAIQVNPNQVVALSASGWCRMALGDHNLAVEHFLKSLQLSPVDRFSFLTMNGVARCYFFMGRNEDALTWVERALAGGTNQLPALRSLAAIEAAAGHLERAHRVAMRILNIDPQHRVASSSSLRTLRRPEDRRKYAEALRLAGIPE